VRDAIEREKRIKRWRRAWKVALIEKDNPEWSELSSGLDQVLIQKGMGPGSALGRPG
jgi:hypothetical protein